jgi:outer membrane receptor protein involved in Fe transport
MGGTAFNYQTFPSNGIGLQDTIEARLASAADSRLKWIVGAFYLKASNSTYSTVNGVSTVFVDAKSSAVFGQLTWPVSDSFRLVGGLRSTSDKKSFTSTNANLSGFQPPYPGSGGGSWSRVDYKAGLEFDLSPRSMLYATIATGYRPGSIQTGSSALINAQLGLGLPRATGADLTALQLYRYANPIPVANKNLVTNPEKPPWKLAARTSSSMIACASTATSITMITRIDSTATSPRLLLPPSCVRTGKPTCSSVQIWFA